MRHDFGDHRRCERFPRPCEVSEHHPAIRQAAHAALARTDRAYAVVCLACSDDDGPRVLATVGRLWDAKGLRNGHNRGRHGYDVQEQKGLIYCVDRDGDFL